MVYLIFVEIIALLLFCFIVYHVVKYRNPYKLYMVFGKKGSGKTTLMNKLAVKYRKKGWSVYSNSRLPGCYYFPIDEFGKISFPEDSLILIDEVGLIWDNRDFKSFPKHVKTYFKYQRQYKNTVYLFSQTFDVDKKIRDLTDHLYIVQNVLNCFSVARRVTKTVTVVHADKSAQGESKIVDDYKIDSWIYALAGSVEITYIPKWVKYFKSFDPPQLSGYDFEVVPDVAKNPKGPIALARALKGLKQPSFNSSDIPDFDCKDGDDLDE